MAEVIFAGSYVIDGKTEDLPADVYSVYKVTVSCPTCGEELGYLTEILHPYGQGLEYKENSSVCSKCGKYAEVCVYFPSWNDPRGLKEPEVCFVNFLERPRVALWLGGIGAYASVKVSQGPYAVYVPTGVDLLSPEGRFYAELDEVELTRPFLEMAYDLLFKVREVIPNLEEGESIDVHTDGDGAYALVYPAGGGPAKQVNL